MFAYRWRTVVPICTKLGMLILWNQEEILGWWKLLKKVSMFLNPMRLVSVSWELSTNVAKTKVVCCDRGITEIPATTTKTILRSSPGEDVFCRSEAKHDWRMAQRTKLFVSTRRLQEVTLQTRKLSWVRVSVKMFGLYPGVPELHSLMLGLLKGGSTNKCIAPQLLSHGIRLSFIFLC
jgi:hypothetical protein